MYHHINDLNLIFNPKQAAWELCISIIPSCFFDKISLWS